MADEDPTGADPKGYYALLGVDPGASMTDITAAYRRLARVLHPDIPATGDASRFIAVKQAYDLLSDPQFRATYDRVPWQVRPERFERDPSAVPFPPVMVEPAMRRPRVSDVPLLAWIVVGVVVAVSGYQLIRRLAGDTPEKVVTRPVTAPSAAPAQAAAISPLPSRPAGLPGTPNHYTTPGPGPITVWRLEAEANRLVPMGQLQPFTPVQALRLFRQPGLIEIKVSDTANGLVQAARLTPGNEAAAQRAFCTFHAGPPPQSAEVIELMARGNESLVVQNREASPAVVTLRDTTGRRVASVFVGPGEEAQVNGLPSGEFRPDFAFGEVWSKPCRGFAVGMRAWRMAEHRPIAALTPLRIPPNPASPNRWVELSDLAFSAE